VKAISYMHISRWMFPEVV